VVRVTTLAAAGWKGIPAKDFLGFQLEVGVRVEYSPASAAKLSPAASALSDALNGGGIVSVAASRAELENDVIIIRVGKKP
jgi:hypothetical protein